MFIISPHVIDLDLETLGRDQAARMRDLTVVEAMQDDADEDDLERKRRDLEREELRRLRQECTESDLERRRAELDHNRNMRKLHRREERRQLKEDIREWRLEEAAEAERLRREAEDAANAGPEPVAEGESV